MPTPDDRDGADFLADASEAIASGFAPPPPPDGLPPEVRARLTGVLSTLRLVHQELSPARAAPPGPPPRYALRRLHGMGGLGEVWLARDEVLGRDIALKEIRAERQSDGRLQERLLREARVNGRLQHPGIVPVYDLVPDPGDGPPFFTMRFVEGETLAAAARALHTRPVAARRRETDLRPLLAAFASVCKTVAYAHSRDVVHRDLKGDNVLLGEYGEVVVIDWGLAKLTAEPEEPRADPDPSGAGGTGTTGLTDAGAVLGTPAYMAPEQAAGGDRADARTDIYGLGAILHEVLTGRPPFVGESNEDILRQVREGKSPDPRAAAKGVPRGLAAICRKATARNPADRYPTADALAADVERWMGDEPPAAYPEPPAATAGRFVRRHYRAVVAGATLFVVAASGVVAVDRTQTRAALRLAAADARARQDAERQTYYHRIALAERELNSGNLSRAARVLNECPKSTRGWEWDCLRRMCTAEPQLLRGHAAAVGAVAFHPKAAELASAGLDGSVIVWDLATGKQRLVLAGAGGGATTLAYSPDGSRLANAGRDGIARVWDATDGRELVRVTCPGGPVEQVLFGPDSGRLYTRVESRVQTWDSLTGRLAAETPAAWQVRGVALTPEGTPLVLADLGGDLVLADPDRQTVVAHLPGSRPNLRGLASAPDAGLLASVVGGVSTGGGTEVLVFEPSAGRPVRLLEGHADPVLAVAFAPKAVGRMATAGLDRAIKIWDPEAGQEVASLRGHADAVRCVAFSADGRRLASGGDDRAVRVWDARRPGQDDTPRYQQHILTGHGERVEAVAYLTANGRDLLGSVGTDGDLRVWDPDAGQLVGTRPVPGTGHIALAADPRGEWFATVPDTGELLRITPAGKRARLAPGLRLDGPATALAVSPTRQRLAAAGRDHDVRLCDLPAGQATRVLSGHTQTVSGMVFDRHGSWLATASWDGTVRVWDAATGAARQVLGRLPVRFGGVGFLPDGTAVAAGASDGAVRVWDTSDGRLVATAAGHAGTVHGLAVRADGRFVATASGDWSVKLWRVGVDHQLAEVRTLRGHSDQVRDVAFRPDGTQLASCGSDGTVRLWDVSDLE